ncbi:calmodulin-like [Juglans regia]|uniref:Calmodulin-like n=1 Tax=Juglans regia TaxID=51240 RepID=A0A6P9E2C6_JUGRE|nr:calmodulin-like [Juglans regia]
MFSYSYPTTCNKNLGPEFIVVPIPETYKEIRVPKNLPMKYNEAQLRERFRGFDKNGDGVLSRQELRSAFYSLGSYVPDWRAHRAIRHADINGDGYIDEAELENLVRYAFQLGYTIK